MEEIKRSKIGIISCNNILLWFGYEMFRIDQLRDSQNVFIIYF